MGDILVAENITKVYGQYTTHPFEALHGISLRMQEGEFICVMGPSGSGKTTLLNTLSTIDVPTTGKVYIDGQDTKMMSEFTIGSFRHGILGFIFQEFNLLDNLTVFQNIAIPLSLGGVADEEITRKVNETAKVLGVDPLLERYPSECSGGQRQRIAIARARFTNPKIIVADEPTGNLDQQTGHELLELFRKLNDELGVSVLMVTHDPMIASYSDRLLYIKDGIISNELHRGEAGQRDYFLKIVEISSTSQQMFL